MVIEIAGSIHVSSTPLGWTHARAAKSRFTYSTLERGLSFELPPLWLRSVAVSRIRLFP